jgi:hypothetical protein
MTQPSAAQAAVGGRPRIGLNLEGNSYFSVEITFTNAFKHSQGFFAQKEGAGWAQSDPGAVTFGPDGYPTAIATGHAAISLWDPPKGYPRGPMVLLWDGAGSVSLLWVDKITGTGQGRIAFDLPGTPSEKNRIGVKITATAPGNPVRNIRVVPITEEAAFVKGEPQNPFRAPFLQRWSKIGAFRYMDWGSTNNSPITSWESRTKPTSQTQGERGVALEYQIAHANITNTHPWFCIPHLATDDYVRQAATLIRDTLKPELKPRIEYSNEVWNNMFGQARYALEKAASLPGQQSNYEGQLRWYSKRSVEIFKIFSDVFTKGGNDPNGLKRLVRVMASHAVNPWASEQVLEYEDAYKHVDALAIAPYFGSMLQGDEARQWLSAGWEVRTAKAEAALKESFEHMDKHVAMLRDNSKYKHIKLFAYEGGQHFLAHPEMHKDERFTQALVELNRRPEMQEFYFLYLKHWHEIGGADFMIFSSMFESSKHGSWGLTEYEGQPDPPKLQGVLRYLEWAKQQPDQNVR